MQYVCEHGEIIFITWRGMCSHFSTNKHEKQQGGKKFPYFCAQMRSYI
jgi:hypothetical protein